MVNSINTIPPKKKRHNRIFRKGVLFGLCLFCTFSLFAQKSNPTPPILETLLPILTKSLSEGDEIALRDLAKFHDKYPDNQSIKSILNQHTLFKKEEWNWASNSKNQSFTQFFYDQEEHLRFSELLKVFYLTPIEERTAQIEIIPKAIDINDPILIKSAVNKITQHLKNKEVDLLITRIETFENIPNPTLSIILKDLLRKKDFLKLKNSQKEQLATTILKLLPDSLAFEELLILTKNQALPLVYCQQHLANLSNNFFVAYKHQDLITAYEKLRIALGNQLAIFKEYGYNKVDLTPTLFFKEKVDYYGWILSTIPDSLYWIQRNALMDMLATQHPKALFYTAGVQFRNWQSGSPTNNFWFNLLRQQVDVHVQIKTPEKLIKLPDSPASQLQYIIYWSKHYEDYVWDVTQNRYINQQLFAEELENYDRYFRRLNSTNDSIAQLAFSALAMGKPTEIKKLIKKFKPLLRNYNASLPPLKYKILEQISLLTQFCQQNNFVYKTNSTLKVKLDRLAQFANPQERFLLENKLIESVTLDELTAIEYYAALNAQNLDLNYSISRILSHAYNKHWSNIITNDRFLRFYLFKTQLFRGLGGFGFAKKYNQKITVNEVEILKKLNELKVLEINPLIQKSIRYLLNQNSDTANLEELNEFLSNPSEISRENLEQLPPIDQHNLHRILQALFQQEDKKAIKKIEDYIKLHASTTIVPKIFETPQKQWSKNKKAGKVLINVLEKIYHFSFSSKQNESIEKWWDLWRTNAPNHTTWSELLFHQQLVKIQTDQSLTINDINKITQSVFYQEIYREICLNSLKKVSKSRTIYRLKIKPAVSIDQELFYLDSLDFSYKELANLCKIFQKDNSDKLLTFILQRITDIEVEQQSALFNSLFRQQWFIDYVSNGDISPTYNTKIKTSLQTYLAQSNFLTEFEETNTLLNILQLEHAYSTLKEKLVQISGVSIQENIRYPYLQFILSRIHFYEIIIAFPILANMNIEQKDLFVFLNKDFGLPMFDLTNEQSAQQIQTQLNSLTEYEFYYKSLLDFGLPIQHEDSTINFDQIYQLLEYDLVVPFIGEGGQYRDVYVYGLIKLLELHFNTTLGFHEKLNENQTFYTFNSYKRVKAWKEYLEKTGEVVLH